MIAIATLTDLQDMIAALLVATAAIYVAWRLVAAVRRPTGGCSSCRGCSEEPPGQPIITVVTLEIPPRDAR
jgi:hypothetical protein